MEFKAYDTLQSDFPSRTYGQIIKEISPCKGNPKFSPKKKMGEPGVAID